VGQDARRAPNRQHGGAINSFQLAGLHARPQPGWQARRRARWLLFVAAAQSSQLRPKSWPPFGPPQRAKVRPPADHGPHLGLIVGQISAKGRLSGQLGQLGGPNNADGPQRYALLVVVLLCLQPNGRSSAARRPSENSNCRRTAERPSRQGAPSKPSGTAAARPKWLAAIWPDSVQRPVASVQRPLPAGQSVALAGGKWTLGAGAERGPFVPVCGRPGTNVGRKSRGATSGDTRPSHLVTPQTVCGRLQWAVCSER